MGTAALSISACAPKAGKVTVDSKSASEDVSSYGNVVQHLDGIGLLGYGSMRLDSYKDENGKDVYNSEKMNSMIEIAMAHGINYFDTAYSYHLCKLCKCTIFQRYIRMVAGCY